MNHKAACDEAATEEAELVQEMQQYFVQAKGHAGGMTAYREAPLICPSTGRSR
jgi:hypothetical protein